MSRELHTFVMSKQGLIKFSTTIVDHMKLRIMETF